MLLATQISGIAPNLTSDFERNLYLDTPNPGVRTTSRPGIGSLGRGSHSYQATRPA
jgi:hypothetical protein